MDTSQWVQDSRPFWVKIAASDPDSYRRQYARWMLEAVLAEGAWTPAPVQPPWWTTQQEKPRRRDTKR